MIYHVAYAVRSAGAIGQPVTRVVDVEAETEKEAVGLARAHFSDMGLDTVYPVACAAASTEYCPECNGEGGCYSHKRF